MAAPRMWKRPTATMSGWYFRLSIRPKDWNGNVCSSIWVVDGRFPSMYSFVTDEELEEERRLFYVSVTRAKRHLFLTYPINVYDKTSGMLLSKPSRFLDHVSSDLLEHAGARGGRRTKRLAGAARPLFSSIISRVTTIGRSPTSLTLL